MSQLDRARDAFLEAGVEQSAIRIIESASASDYGGIVVPVKTWTGDTVEVEVWHLDNVEPGSQQALAWNVVDPDGALGYSHGGGRQRDRHYHLDPNFREWLNNLMKGPS